MKKLTPTSVILMIAGIGAILFLFFYYKEKRAKTKMTELPPTQTTAPQNVPPVVNTPTNQAVRLVRTPVGFMTR